MKSIRTKLVLSLLGCTAISVIICGGTSIFYSNANAYQSSNDKMRLECSVQSNKMENTLQQISHSVDALANISLSYLDDFEKFKQDDSYVDNYAKELEPIYKAFSEHIDGAITAYIRFNPDFTKPDSGFFLVKDEKSAEFLPTKPTDFTIYSKDDKTHVEWYYIPIESKKHMWMDPYYNSNLNVYMISYVAPLFINGEAVGVTGIDVDFSIFAKQVEQASIYQTGSAFLSSQEGTIIYHKTLATGTSLFDYYPELKEKLSSANVENELIKYQYNGSTKYLFTKKLSNGMFFNLTATKAEAQQKSIRLVQLILNGDIFSILVSIAIGLFISRKLIKPIKKLEEIILETSRFCFESNNDAKKLGLNKDETGEMARSIETMRENFKGIANSIGDAQEHLTDVMDKLTETSYHVAQMSEDNSATTEELSAAMQETSATMDIINTNVQSIKQSADTIKFNCERGEQTAIEVKNRAIDLHTTTLAGSERTKALYENLVDQSKVAIEKSAAVKQISHLANVILEISEQTNLLALNASIEAARAGDAGKGFRVVASEIDKLAAQTSQTTESIKKMINEMNDAVNSLSSCITDSTNFLQTNVMDDYISFIKVSIQYKEDAATYEEGMAKISQSIEELTRAILEISDSIDGMNTVINESAVGITDIAEKTQETTLEIEKNNAIIDSTNQQIEKLQNIIDVFHQSNK